MQIRAFACCPTGGAGLNRVLPAAGGRGQPGTNRSGRRCSACTSGPLGSGLVLLNELAGMRPWALTVMPWACAHARMLPLRSRLDAVRPPRAGLSPPGLAGMLDERCELAAQRRSVLLAQIDLLLGAIDPESHRFIGRPPSRSSWSSTVIFCAIPDSWLRWRYLHQDQLYWPRVPTAPAAAPSGCTRLVSRSGDT